MFLILFAKTSLIAQTGCATFTGLSASYCANDPAVTLVGNPAGGIFSGPGVTGNNFSPATAGLGSHMVIYSYSDAFCTDVDTQFTQVFQFPGTVDAGSNVTICEGSSTLLNATLTGGAGTPAWLWQPTNGLSDPTIPNPVASPLFTTTYTVSVYDSSGGAGFGGGAVYVRSVVGAPWGQITNETAMDDVFGIGQWQDLRYETVNVNALFSPANCFIYLEGGNDNATELEAFLIANLPQIENWVASGGALFLNAGPNEDNGMSYGFGGVTMAYPVYTTDAVASAPAHPVFNGPWVPVGTAFNGGYFGHGSLSGGGISPLIEKLNDPAILSLAEKNWGLGRVIFGTMPTHNYHGPSPQVGNLRRNIFEYLFASCGGNGCVSLDSVTITVNPRPSVELNGIRRVYCVTQAQDTAFGIPGGGILTGPGVNGFIFDPGAAGVGSHLLFYTYTDGLGCSNTDTLNVEVFPNPGTVTVSNDTLICEGDTIQLSAVITGGAGTPSYFWSPATGLDDPNSPNPLASPLVTTTYTLTVSDTAAGPAFGGGAVYLRSAVGAPWGQNANETAMDLVFGNGQWQDLRYELADANVVFSAQNCFVFMEGGDNTADEMETFLNTHQPLIENWVSQGGALLLNAGPNEGNGMNYGFGGVSLIYGGSLLQNVVASLPAHPIFNGPYLPVGTAFSGNSFSHAFISGPGITKLIESSTNPTQICLAEKSWGFGRVLFGGMTTNNFHGPQPHATNLRQNILEYLNEICNEGGCSASDQVTISVSPTPLVSFSGLLPQYCLTDSAVTLIGSPPGGVFTGPGVGGIFFDPFLAGNGQHQIHYQYTDPIGCQNEDSLSTEVLSAPTLVDAGQDDTICLGDTLILSLNVAGGGNPTYFWSPPTGLSDPRVANPLAYPQTTTTYVISVADGGVGTVGAAYVRSVVGAPWGSNSNETAMDAVFGPGNWQSLRFETLNPNLLFSAQNCFIFMEGSDNTADEMEAFLTTNIAIIENWVNLGGTLFLNAAPTEGDGMSYGFGGVNLQFTVNTPINNVIASIPGHAIFSGPWLPSGNLFSGTAFSHGLISGGATSSLLNQQGDPSRVCLAELTWGTGKVFFGGMTPATFQTPAPNAQNLRNNIVDYLQSFCQTGGCALTDTLTIFVDPNCVITANDDNGTESELSVYPNPVGSAGIRILNFSGIFQTGSPYQIELFDLFGRKLKSWEGKCDGKIISLDLGHFAAGLYVVRVNDSLNSFSRKVQLE